jgi:hypothetical protein
VRKFGAQLCAASRLFPPIRAINVGHVSALVGTSRNWTRRTKDGRLQMRHMVGLERGIQSSKGYTVISLASFSDRPTNVHCAPYVRQSPSAMLKIKLCHCSFTTVYCMMFVRTRSSLLLLIVQ